MARRRRVRTLLIELLGLADTSVATGIDQAALTPKEWRQLTSFGTAPP